MKDDKTEKIDVQSDESLLDVIDSAVSEAGAQKIAKARVAISTMTISEAGSLLSGFGGVINPDVLDKLKSVVDLLLSHVELIAGHGKFSGQEVAELVDSSYFGFQVPRAVAVIVEGQEEGVTLTTDLYERAFAIIERHPQVDDAVKEALRGYQSLIKPVMMQASRRKEIRDITS